MTAEVKEQRFEGPGMDKPRDVKRVWIEVDVTPTNGMEVGGHYCDGPNPLTGKSGVHRVEVYVDQLPQIRAMVRTPAQLAQLEVAKGIAQAAQQRWLRETKGKHLNRLTPEERERAIAEECPINEWTIYGTLSEETRAGMPPIASLKVIDLAGEAHPVEVFEKRPEDFLRDAPTTPENAARRANEHLAATMARALGGKRS